MARRQMGDYEEDFGANWFDGGGQAPARAKPGGSDPPAYRAVATVTAPALATGVEAGRGAVANNAPVGTARPEVAPPQANPAPNRDGYEGKGDYTYKVDGDRIYILKSGYGGGRDYSAAPREVKKGTAAYNAIVAELNSKHGLGLKPTIAAAPPSGSAPKPGGAAAGAAKPPPPAPPAPPASAPAAESAPAPAPPAPPASAPAAESAPAPAPAPAPDPAQAQRMSIPDHPVTAFLAELPDVSYDDVTVQGRDPRMPMRPWTTPWIIEPEAPAAQPTLPAPANPVDDYLIGFPQWRR